MRARFLLIVLLLAFCLQARSLAHEVPNEVTVLAFLKPDGQTLRFLVRAPMASLRDISIPVKGEGYLDIARADDALRDAATLWISDFVELYEDGVKLPKPTVRAVKAELPSSRAFASYDEAVANVMGPRLPEDTNIYWEQGMLDVLFEYPIRSQDARFAIHPGFTRLGLRVNVGLRLLTPGKPERVFDVHAEGRRRQGIARQDFFILLCVAMKPAGPAFDMRPVVRRDGSGAVGEPSSRYRGPCARWPLDCRLEGHRP